MSFENYASSLRIANLKMERKAVEMKGRAVLLLYYAERRKQNYNLGLLL
jgi:hypothetical protein